MYIFISLVILVGSVFLQTTLSPLIKISGVHPDLVLILVIGWVILRGLEEGVLGRDRWLKFRYSFRRPVWRVYFVNGGGGVSNQFVSRPCFWQQYHFAVESYFSVEFFIQWIGPSLIDDFGAAH